MRQIKLTGRELTIVRTLGFSDSMMGTEIQDLSKLEPEDMADTLNGLMAAGFVQCIPFQEQVDLAEVPVTAFEVNPAYAHELREAIIRR